MLAASACADPALDLELDESIAEQSVKLSAAGDVIKCWIRTPDGHYLSAADGGSRVNDAIYSDAARVGVNERFTLVCQL